MTIVYSLAQEWQCLNELNYGLETNQFMRKATKDLRKHWTYKLLNLPVIYSKRLKATAGKAAYSRKMIILHPALNDKNDPLYEDRFDTFFHELAHFVAYYVDGETGHGFAWQYSMMQFGFQPERCYDPAKVDYRSYEKRKIQKLADQLPDLNI